MFERLLGVLLTLVLATVSSGDDSSALPSPDSRIVKSTLRDYPPTMDGAVAEVYKTVGDTQLKVYIYYPKEHSSNESRPAAVFFFGGGWKAGTPRQFEHQCRYLASRGMVAMTADYRVATRHGTTAKTCVADAKSAVRWIRSNAARLGVNPDRILAGGGSAGGHLAACLATVSGFDEVGEATSISATPNGLALFNPAVVLAPLVGESLISDAKLQELSQRMGTAAEKLSPYHQLQPGLPPTIVFHGKADTTVPYRSVQLFAEKAMRNGDYVVLHGFDDEGHGFFNFGRNGNLAFDKTLDQLDRFLVDTAFLQGK